LFSTSALLLKLCGYASHGTTGPARTAVLRQPHYYDSNGRDKPCQQRRYHSCTAAELVCSLHAIAKFVMLMYSAEF
jgi:hypothetical protein